MDSQGYQPDGWRSDDTGEGPSQPNQYILPIADCSLVYCASCNRFVADPWLCVGSNHLIPDFVASWIPSQNLEATQTHDNSSPLATQPTTYSDATNTGSSYYPDPELRMAGHQEFNFLTNPSTTTDWTGPMHDLYAEGGNAMDISAEYPCVPDERHAVPTIAVTSSSPPPPLNYNAPHTYLSNSQTETLERFRQRWASQDYRPTDIEFQSIATLEQLELDIVRAWFHVHLQLPATTSISATSGSSKGKQRVAPAQSSDKPSQTVAEVRAWARNKFRQPCKGAQTQHSRTDLPFKCTSGCSYSTDKIDAWRRHELSWQPQHFWHCVRCRSNGSPPFICARKDKYLDHLKAAHADVNKGLRKILRNSSEVSDAVGFERQCKFMDALGRRCPLVFQSWEERLRHYLAHFRDQISFGPWTLAYGRHRWFDDDGPDEQGRSSGSTSSGSSNTHDPSSTSSGSFGTSMGSSGYSQQRSGQHGTAVVMAANERTQPLATASPLRSDLRCRECSTQQPTRPTLLVHIPSARLVEPPLNAKYLALDHTWAAKAPASVASTSLTNLTATDLLLTDDKLPIPLEQLRAFAHGIGHSYLWIAELCEPQSRRCVLRSIQDRASLHMVSVRCPERPQSFLHFACRSSNVKEVHEWANQGGTISHVRNLGHGSYGIVDEVKVNPGQQVLARKELSTSRLRNQQGTSGLQEVLIMQRLSHPHISHSKSAYYDHTLQSWNILMTPVADGTLRDYMAEPNRWPDRRSNIARWYLCLAAALEYMHGACCRHKDIKPANILLSGRDVLLTDFGTSHDFSTDNDALAESWTEGHALMTPRYAAPEVALEQRRGTKADVFSLGCVYAEMLTIELGHTIEDMHRGCGMAGKRGATYAKHTRYLHRWIDTLGKSTISGQHQAIIAMCKIMTSPRAEDRPPASVVLDTIAQHGEPAIPSHHQCSCLSRRPLTMPVSRPLSLHEHLPNNQPRGVRSTIQRTRSGRGRRCRSRIMPRAPQASIHVDSGSLQQLWYYRPAWKYQSPKLSSAIYSIAICSFALSGNFFGMYLETQIVHSSMTLSIILSQGMHALDNTKDYSLESQARHDRKRFKKLYWKALCVVRVVVSSHRGTETQLTDRKCVTRTHGELMLLPLMLQHLGPSNFGSLLSLAHAMASRFGSQTRVITAAIACAQASFLPSVDLQGLLS